MKRSVIAAFLVSCALTTYGNEIIKEPARLVKCEIGVSPAGHSVWIGTYVTKSGEVIRTAFPDKCRPFIEVWSKQ
jgi:hypothetical protein